MSVLLECLGSDLYTPCTGIISLKIIQQTSLL